MATVSWKTKTKRSRLPIPGRGDRGARVVFLGGHLAGGGARPSSRVGFGTQDPNNRDRRCEREDSAQSDVMLRNLGRERGELKCLLTTVTFFFSL